MAKGLGSGAGAGAARRCPMKREKRAKPAEKRILKATVK